MGFQNKETLCWRCKRPGTGSCSWDASRGSVPVEGWTADEVPFRERDGSHIRTYHVIDCPLFELDEDYVKRMKHACGLAQEGKRAESRKRREEIENLFRYGWTDKAIALRYGLKPNTVNAYRCKWRKQQREQERKVENEYQV